MQPARNPSTPPAPAAPPVAPAELDAASPRARASTRDGSGWAIPVGWPPLGQVNYVKEVITTFLLLLTVPYVVVRLLRSPSGLVSDLGQKHVKP